VAPRWKRLDVTSDQALRFYSAPAYLVLGSEKEAAAALGVSSWSASPSVDLSQEIIVSVHRGECRTGGYSVDITDLTIEPGAGGRAGGDFLRVRLSLTDPSPSDFVSMAITYPEVAVAVERRGIQGVSAIVFVDAKGKVLKTVEVSP
jgi:hypothetical protein